MKKLIKFEFHKLLRQKSFYICTIVAVAMSLIGIVITKTLSENNIEGMAQTALSGMQSLLSAVNSSSFIMISGIFLALFACGDYDQQTIKNIYARGFSKNNVYFAKLITGLCAVVVMFAVTLVSSYIAGTSFFGNDAAETGNYFALLIGQLAVVLSLSAFTFAVSLIFKKVGIAIALSILGPSLVGTVLSLGDSLLKFESFKLSNYWINGFMSDLSALSVSTERLVTCIVLAVVYAAAFILAGCFINKKYEL